MLVKKWISKAIVQKVISILPYKNNINHFFQKYITKGVELSDLHFYNKITHAKDHVNYLRQHKELEDACCLELGTGWYPVVPLFLYLSGAKKIYTIDINAHLSKASLIKTIEKFLEYKKNHYIKNNLYKNNERWNELKLLYQNHHTKTLSQLLSAFNIKSIVGDARKINLDQHSIDFICSNNTFEHIYPDVLAAILSEFKRLLKSDGLMSHFIDMSDHFAHFDSSISIYNFLKFSEKQWRWIDNTIQPQNRMRFHQYQQMYKQLHIPFETGLIRKGDVEALSEIKLKNPFNKFSKEQLAVSHGYMFSNLSHRKRSAIYKHTNLAQSV